MRFFNFRYALSGSRPTTKRQIARPTRNPEANAKSSVKPLVTSAKTANASRPIRVSFLTAQMLPICVHQYGFRHGLAWAAITWLVRYPSRNGPESGRRHCTCGLPRHNPRRPAAETIGRTSVHHQRPWPGGRCVGVGTLGPVDATSAVGDGNPKRKQGSHHWNPCLTGSGERI